MKIKSLALLFGVLASLCCPSLARAGELVLGQTAPLSGPTQALGQGMKLGLEIAFKEINAAGGVHGQALKLVSRDDGYEPARAKANAQALLTDDKVFALIGCVGTPTAVEVMPVTDAAGAHFIGAFTGAAALRTPFNPLIVNVRASYAQEIERLVQLLVDGRDLRKIACFYQDDAYGQAGLKALQAALAKRKLTPHALGHYTRNTTEVTAALEAIAPGQPDAIVMVGTYGACAEFIKRARAAGLSSTVYCNISFVGTLALIGVLGPDAEGVIVSQVVPNPIGSTLKSAQDYRAALATHAPEAQPDWISLEGYLAGHLFAQVAQRAGPNLTRETFAAALTQTDPIDLKGLSAQFGPTRNQAFDRVYVTQVRGGKIVSID